MIIFTKISLMLCGLFFASNTYAYLDPGTLNIIIQSIIAGVVAFLSIITVYWNKVISFITKFIKKRKS